VAALPSGDPNKGEVVIGSVVGRPTVERVQRLVSDAVANGASVLTGGGSDCTVMKGIVVDRVTPGMQLFREGSFGPHISDHSREVGRKGDPTRQGGDRRFYRASLDHGADRTETLSGLICLTFSLRRFSTAAINNLGSIGFVRWS
jgi:Aldehyde dehydrogenase family